MLKLKFTYSACGCLSNTFFTSGYVVGVKKDVVSVVCPSIHLSLLNCLNLAFVSSWTRNKISVAWNVSFILSGVLYGKRCMNAFDLTKLSICG